MGQKASAEQEQKREYAACEKVTAPLIKSLRELDSRLSVGMSNVDYNRQVGTAKARYDDVAADFGGERTISYRCIDKVVVPLEEAMQEHLDAVSVWNRCVESTYCDIAFGKPNEKTQTAWINAPAKVEIAQDGLAELRP